MGTVQRTVCLAVCGGISAYKSVEIASTLYQSGLADINVIMTESATKFICPLSFEAVIRKRIIHTEFPEHPAGDDPESIYPHIYPASRSDVFIVAPATANILAKLATGIADDVVSASALALKPECKKVICPAMNVNMWNSDAVQHNVRILEQRGWIRIGPDSGHLACNDKGTGRMSSPQQITDTVKHLLTSGNKLAGLTVLILSGPTHEYIDPVRFIANASSGIMGKKLAEEAQNQGAHVIFISGPVAQENLPAGVELIQVHTAEQMLSAARARYNESHICLCVAAVADYTPQTSSTNKMHRKDDALNLALRPTADIAAELGKNKTAVQLNIGFALETDNGEESARRKLDRKNFDAIVLNSTDSFASQSGTFTLFKVNDKKPDVWGKINKTDCARKLLDYAAVQYGKIAPKS